MVKMKALRSFGIANANEGHVSRGSEFTAANEQRARDLEEGGLAFRLDTMITPKPVNKTEVLASNKAAETGPLALAGGLTGAEPAPSSSPPARRLRKPRSKRPEGELGL